MSALISRAATPAAGPSRMLTALARTGNRATAPSRVVVAEILRRGYATPSGPLPPGFRTKRPTMWDEEKEPMLDKIGRYFLLTEMFRGMYVLLEQFFRPPYVGL